MEKIWLSQYPEGVPEEIDFSAYASLVDFFKSVCNQYRKNRALYSLGSSITYDEFDRLSLIVAAYFQKVVGLKKGDRVALILPNCFQYPITLFGVLRAGLVAVNVNPLYTGRELEHQLKDSGASVAVVLANFASALQNVLDKTEVKHVVVTEIGDLFSQPKSYFINFVVKWIQKAVPAWSIPHAILYRNLIKQAKALVFDEVSVTSADLAFLQYTGGTTGVAKGAMLTHGNMVANLEQASSWIKPFVTPGREVIVTALPLYHIFALLANLFTFMKFGAMNVLITNPRELKRFIREISTLKFTAITGVNTLFNALVNHSDFPKIDFSMLHITLGGGMAVQLPVAEKWQAITGTVLLEAYGLTETSPAVAINPINLKKFMGSIGLPVSSTEIKICGDDGCEVARGESGELCVRGPQVMRGYWMRPDETTKVLSPDGWLATGDVAKIDEQGFLYIVDRKKDMIIVSGFNVYPNEIEAVIAEMPAVVEVAVVGVASEQTGEAIKAFIVPRDPSLTADAVIQYCHSKLTRYKVPKIIEFRSELPKSNVGKILKRLLREG